MISVPPKRPIEAVPGHWERGSHPGLGSSAIRHAGRAHDALHDAAASSPACGAWRGFAHEERACVLAGHGTEAVRDAIPRTIITLPEELRRSLTWDQGAEMAQHDRLTIDAGVQVYFCDPQSPSQRGTNENTNGLLRQYFHAR